MQRVCCSSAVCTVASIQKVFGVNPNWLRIAGLIFLTVFFFFFWFFYSWRGGECTEHVSGGLPSEIWSPKAIKGRFKHCISLQGRCSQPRSYGNGTSAGIQEVSSLKVHSLAASQDVLCAFFLLLCRCRVEF